METVIRVAFVYVFVLLALRVVGKREFGQLTPFDLVTLLLIPDLVTQALLRGGLLDDQRESSRCAPSSRWCS